MADLSGPGLDLPFTIDEGEVTTLTANINGAEVSIRCCCVKCYAWQDEFDAKAKYHRCVKCGLLQNIASFQPSVTAKISVAGNFGEDDFKLSNSVLKNHLQEEGLVKLLLDAQNVEEHLLEMGMCSFKIQNNVVTAFSQVKDERKSEGEPECANLLGEAASLLGEDEEGEMESWFDEGVEMGSKVLLPEAMPTEAKRLDKPAEAGN